MGICTPQVLPTWRHGPAQTLSLSSRTLPAAMAALTSLPNPRVLASCKDDSPSASVVYPLCKKLDRRNGLVSQNWSPVSAQSGLHEQKRKMTEGN